MINKEDDNVIEDVNVDAVIRVELTNELSPADIQDIGDTKDTNSCCVNNTNDLKRYKKEIYLLILTKINFFGNFGLA